MGRLDLNDIREMFSCSNHTTKDDTTSEPVVRQKYIALDIYIISKKNPPTAGTLFHTMSKLILLSTLYCTEGSIAIFCSCAKILRACFLQTTNQHMLGTGFLPKEIHLVSGGACVTSFLL